MAIQCTYCEERINAKRGIYIKCTTCHDINLCLECFSAGVVIASHENDHPYELIDCGSFPILDETWKAYEELALLEAIELYGIGSWTDIAKSVETRSAEECRNRYLTVYVDNYFGRRTWDAVEPETYNVHDHTTSNDHPLSPTLSLPEKQKIVDINKEQQLRLGYMPKRDDFEREYDNNAEFLVSKLAVNANDDTELDEELKIAHINMYTDRLRERFRRKRVVLEYNLVKLFFHMHSEENGDSHDDTSLQYNDSLPALDNLCEDQISNAINMAQQTSNDSDATTVACQLQNTATSKVIPSATGTNNSKTLSANSILNYFNKIEPLNDDEIERDDAQKSSKTQKDKQGYSILSSYFSDLNKTIAEKDFNTMEEKLRIFCQFSSAEVHNQLIRNLAREKELKVKIKELIKRQKNGHRKLSNSKVSDNAKTINRDASIKLSQSQKKNPSKNSPAHEIEVSMDVDDSQDKTSLTPTKVKKNNNTRNESTKAIASINYSPDNESSWRLLTDGERRLCKKSNLKPSQYIAFKTFLLKENGQKKKKGASQRLFTGGDIDKTVKRRIQDFLARHNWIKV